MSDQSSQYHLSVGTEVSAKYRGAFCEAKIKSLKKSVIFTVKPINKSTPKSHPLSEDCVKGNLKIGANVEARLTDQTTWCPAVITRNFLCLQGKYSGDDDVIFDVDTSQESVTTQRAIL